MPRGKKPDHVDVHVGNLLRTLRTLHGLSQAELAEQLDITFQQLQKYEKGANRTTSGLLWQASKVLDVPISYFFERLDGEADAAAGILSTRAGLEFVRNYESCSEDVRKSANLLCKAVAQDLGPATDKETT
jgi:transcriptional regulator with XRE-family HTH domain